MYSTELNRKNMIIIKKNSIEKIGLAAVFSCALSPFLASLLHYPFVRLTGGDADAYRIIFGAGLTALISGISYYFFSERKILRISITCAVSIVLSIILEQGFLSRVTLAGILSSLGIILSFLMDWTVGDLPFELDGLAKKYRWRTALFLILSAFSAAQTARLSVFINDSKYTEASLLPDIPFFVTHSCLTAYTHAYKLAKEGKERLYDPKNWPENSTEEYPPFGLDLFMYPPPFILLPSVLFSLTDSFQTMRAVWFGCTGLLMAFAFWKTAKWTSSKNQPHSMLLIYLAWSSMAVMTTLQVGNVQHAVMAISILAMFAFERNRPALGGALLAFAIASKISPGLLTVILIVQRRWKDLAWTAGFGIFFTALSIVFFGINPFIDFITYQLPLLNSGKAMPWMDKDAINILMNVGPFGIPFRLGLLGMEFDNPWRTAKIISSVYTVLAVTAVIFFSRKEKNIRQKACFWLAVLTLSGLQSPFAPGYVFITLLWAVTLMASEIKNRKGLIIYIMGWILLTIPLLPVIPIPYLAAASLLQQAIYFTSILIILSFRSYSSETDQVSA